MRRRENMHKEKSEWHEKKFLKKSKNERLKAIFSWSIEILKYL